VLAGDDRPSALNATNSGPTCGHKYSSGVCTRGRGVNGSIVLTPIKISTPELTMMNTHDIFFKNGRRYDSDRRQNQAPNSTNTRKKQLPDGSHGVLFSVEVGTKSEYHTFGDLENNRCPAFKKKTDK